MTPEPELVAAVATRATSRGAHRLAGNAVAAVVRGGTLTDVHLGYTDWSTSDDSDDIPGEVHHQTDFADWPFVTFAGLWAEAMWTVENDPDVDDLAEALEYVWADGCADTAKYDERVQALTDLAEKLGLPLTEHVWEADWIDELEPLWGAVCEVAALLIGGNPVTQNTITMITEDTGDD
jgi:hypothetical protein